ncbi:LysR family transcriptional regulator [Marinobacter sp. UBA2688]|uniref:LysR family transcriptional regulator n=1 Tax=Marinobacter sp. UBA2688 TaxID=1946816 RepID=UPI00257C8D5A|nr:LysR family transcriptional regulator [Marinobacter sp. UBA2688]|tara:strand:- start:6710 stop:7609 length:900 start_codon:yes stop_codon:yes gene_type:complete
MQKSDLGLIKVFLSIYEDGSVSKAAETLNLTQPSVSYSLSRLRDLLNDSLFTRTRDGMKPTFAAEQYYRVFASSVGNIERAIALARDFDAAISTKTFRIALSDLGEFYLLPKLLEALREKAPNCKLEIVTTEIPKIEEELLQGRIDLAIGNLSFLRKSTKSILAFTENYSCIVSSSHPRLKETVTKEQFLEENHIYVSKASGHFDASAYLRNSGETIKIGLHIPHFSSLPAIIPNSQMIACLPSRVAEQFAKSEGIRSFPLPFQAESFSVEIYWVDNFYNSKAKTWLVDLAFNAIAEPS